MMACAHCGHEVPEGEYCGACGAHHVAQSTFRAHSFAADPLQHLLQPNIISTLFPQAPHRHSTGIRLALLVATTVLLLLAVFRVTGPSIAVAAAALPVAYVIYLCEFVVPKRRLLLVTLTFGTGFLLGGVWSFLTGPIVTHAVEAGRTGRISTGLLLATGVLFPLIAQLLMLVGALLVYYRHRGWTSLDGFSFGAASALGFTFAGSLVELSPQLGHQLVGNVPAATGLFVLVGRGLVLPFLNASTTGLLAAAIWHRAAPRRPFAFSWTTTLAVAIAVAALVRITLGTTDLVITHPGNVIGIYAAIAACLILWVRLVLHTTVLSGAVTADTGDHVVCSHCHHVVPTMNFCLHCGISMAANPNLLPDVPPIPTPLAEEPATRPALAHELAAQRHTHHHLRHWLIGAAAIVAGSLILGGAGLALSTSPSKACGSTCKPPPPPCVSNCNRSSQAPPLKTANTFTSSALGFAVDFSDYSPSSTDDRSAQWNLSDNTGQWTVLVTGDNANGESAQQVLNDMVAADFGDYTQLYSIPGAEVGYTPGAGEVLDGQVTPFFGKSTDNRVVILTAVKNGIAIAVVGSGDVAASDPQSTDPSGLPVSGFVNSVTNGVRWPGDPLR